MSLRDYGNILPATRPFADIEEQTLVEYRDHTAFRSDRNFFKANPKMTFAIRRSLSEFDWITAFADCPPPPLYVFVMKISDEKHIVIPMWRGVPYWRQAYCNGYAYADLKADSEVVGLMDACRNIGGMNEVARAQFDRHNQFVALMRAFSSALSFANGKAVN